MDLGMIGLGRMGAGMALRLRRGGHRVVGYDPDVHAAAQATAQGIETVDTLDALVAALAPPRALWLMVPAGAAVESTLEVLHPLLAAGDTVIEGGNSHYADSQRRAAALAEDGIGWLDVGTSGGIRGIDAGYSMTLGGEAALVERLQPLFATLAPSAARGWGRVGPAGAGHYAKMVHNGIEYGLMQAFAEGFAILHHKQEFDFDLAALADIWREGSVIRSWLLDLSAEALHRNPALAGIAPQVADSGEGRWTVAEAIALDVPAPVITHALIARLRSRDGDAFGDRLLASLRGAFGGHGVPQRGETDP
ncbi:decarboxylating 6-phosphogluconate dehydrogenase [Luteimonas yindakuii]|uniref:Decarboxylating 6-phosphogluconate dehydrogenase n=1 Tax=Luteimonas yindakuii TaxID=2565782 RepID=A0A4Z1RG12_9GAMM|nr:decarboxylating 6-phosphogluconate dehydrogenase [Luteimonas yindakuii]TKS55113.1 decarboxylating 6-phosphogluconate dehydrogenase [Luteimonas yindakuii]